MDTMDLDSDDEDLMGLPALGIGCLTVPRAAKLITTDQWFSGEIVGIEEPEDFDGNPNAGWLRDKLASHVAKMELRLVASIDSGRLRTVRLSRDFDDHIIGRNTWIDYDELGRWVSERGYELGDIASEWIDREGELLGMAEDAIRYLRLATKGKKGGRGEDAVLQAQFAKDGRLDEADPAVLAAAIRGLVTENAKLSNRLASHDDRNKSEIIKPVTPRERTTLLCIIGALAREAKLDLSNPYSAGDAVEAMAPELQIKGRTIGDKLKLVAEAMDRRTK